jgi:hypothetical protein
VPDPDVRHARLVPPGDLLHGRVAPGHALQRVQRRLVAALRVLAEHLAHRRIPQARGAVRVVVKLARNGQAYEWLPDPLDASTMTWCELLRTLLRTISVRPSGWEYFARAAVQIQLVMYVSATKFATFSH